MNRKGFIEAAVGRFMWYFVFGIACIVFIILFSLANSKTFDVPAESLAGNDMQAQLVTWLERPMPDGRIPAEVLSTYPLDDGPDLAYLQADAQEAFSGLPSNAWDLVLFYTPSDHSTEFQRPLATSAERRSVCVPDKDTAARYLVPHVSGTSIEIIAIQC